MHYADPLAASFALVPGQELNVNLATHASGHPCLRFATVKAIGVDDDLGTTDLYRG
jgi:hypothetical protein